MKRTPHNEHPFLAKGSLDRETLLRYVQGDLPDEQEHAVELHLAQDPLLAEAAEGLAIPGAIAGAQKLQRPGTGGGTDGAWIISVVIIVLLAGMILHQDGSEQMDPSVEVPHALQHVEPKVLHPMPDMLFQEEEDAPIEEALQRSTVPAPHVYTMPREPLNELLIPRRITMEAPVIQGSPKPAHRQRSGIQLHYLHHLKLIHPKELYTHMLNPSAFTEHRPASMDLDHVTAMVSDERGTAYLRFMEGALAHFVGGSFLQCHTRLQELLDQHPEDVNALFYAALCEHQLGEYATAAHRLEQVQAHHLQIFQEEAEWHRALALDAAGEHGQARQLFHRILQEKGFYAERAQQRLEALMDL